jgi:hypothetical protein
MLDEIPWMTGQDAEKATGNTLIGRFDNMASELRDDEVLRIAAGDSVPDLADNFLDKLPPPRKQREAILAAPPKQSD